MAKLAKTVYGNSLRSDEPLSYAQIYQIAPSIFTETRSQGRSERYLHIPTITVLETLRSEGFEPFMVAQTRSSDREHARHMVRLRRRSDIYAREANEVILLNSHDGTSSYQLLAGMFRAVCQNSLVAGSVIQDFRVRHTGRLLDDVIEGVYSVVEDFSRLNETREYMQHHVLSQDDATHFAESALKLRWDEPPVHATQVLRPRRFEDTRSDLWTTFNRVQEHLLKGGTRYRNTKGRGQSTRRVSAIEENIRLNKGLFDLAMTHLPQVGK